MGSKANSGIQTAADGSAFIPQSQRADGSVRKAIKVRPGFMPTEDVATYKTPTAAAWKDRASGGIPGAEATTPVTEAANRSKNAKRREAARKKAVTMTQDDDLSGSMEETKLSGVEKFNASWRNPSKLATNDSAIDEEAEKQKKIRNILKKLKGIRELKEKKLAGEKLSPDQLIKVGKEAELVRDLQKLGHEGDEPLPG